MTCSDMKRPPSLGVIISYGGGGGIPALLRNAHRFRFAQPLTGHWPVKTLRFESPALPPHMKRPPLLEVIITYGGGGGIRTLVTPKGKTVFETAAFNHSATPP